MKKILIMLATLIFALPITPRAPLTAQQMEEQMLKSYKYQYRFVNQYTAALPITITVKFADGSQKTGEIVDAAPLTFPSNSCITYFEVEGNKPGEKFEAGHSYYQSEQISTSHTQKICGSRTFTIVSIDNDPYIQVNWPTNTKPLKPIF